VVASLSASGRVLAPGRGIVTPEAVVLEFDTAGVPSRALARILDALLAGVVALTLVGMLGQALADENTAVVAFLIAGFGAMFVYPCFCETVWGRTPGKAALGLTVVTDEGGPVRFRQAAIRSALQVVDFLLVPVGVVAVLSALAGRQDQRLGDRLAGTLVVRTASLTMRSRAVGFPPLPGYEGYVAGLDVGTITAQRYEVLRSFLTRVNELSPAARAHLAIRLAEPTAAAMGHAVPPGMHPEVFLASVAAAYQQRHGGPATWMWGPWSPGPSTGWQPGG
jgi:uncharacterized RDD family membrane protein YckC